MEKNRLPIIKFAYISIKAIALFIIIMSAVAYHTPVRIMNQVYDFEKHHIYLFAAISSLVFYIFLRLYLSLTKEEGLLNKKIAALKRNIIEHERGSDRSNQVKYLNIAEATIINKEDIPALKFDNKELPMNQEEIQEIESSLNKAMVLGNSYKQKVKLFFKDMITVRYVETTVWFVGDKHVTLKEGINIPKNQILKVII